MVRGWIWFVRDTERPGFEQANAQEAFMKNRATRGWIHCRRQLDHAEQVLPHARAVKSVLANEILEGKFTLRRCILTSIWTCRNLRRGSRSSVAKFSRQRREIFGSFADWARAILLLRASGLRRHGFHHRRIDFVAAENDHPFRLDGDFKFMAAETGNAGERRDAEVRLLHIALNFLKDFFLGFQPVSKFAPGLLAAFAEDLVGAASYRVIRREQAFGQIALCDGFPGNVDSDRNRAGPKRGGLGFHWLSPSVRRRH